MALTKLNNKAVANVTSIPVALGDMVLVSSATASSSASIEFTLGDYKEYKFFFVNMHPANDIVDFTFQTSADNGSTYGITTTNSYFWTQHNDSDTYAELEYRTDNDLAQSTSFIKLTDDIGNDNDSSACGFLHLFNPSSTTYVKHYIGNVQIHTNGDASRQVFTAGYFNDTNDLTNIKFQMSSGNIDAGKILMFVIN
jgi:hypothetical protein